MSGQTRSLEVKNVAYFGTEGVHRHVTLHVIKGALNLLALHF